MVGVCVRQPFDMTKLLISTIILKELVSLIPWYSLGSIGPQHHHHFKGKQYRLVWKIL